MCGVSPRSLRMVYYCVITPNRLFDFNPIFVVHPQTFWMRYDYKRNIVIRFLSMSAIFRVIM